MVSDKKLVWDKEAISELKEVYKYLKNKSLPSAKRVRDSIIETASELPKHSEIYRLDRFKKGNNNDYRAFEKYNYRVTYRIKETEVRILRVRHTSREPLES